jgi:hypothetical protein
MRALKFMDVNFIHKEGPLNLFHRFSAADYDSVFSFFPARQGSEIVLNESSKITENALQKNTTKYFRECKVNVVFFVINFVSKTGFGIFSAYLVCLKFEK